MLGNKRTKLKRFVCQVPGGVFYRTTGSTGSRASLPAHVRPYPLVIRYTHQIMAATHNQPAYVGQGYRGCDIEAAKEG